MNVSFNNVHNDKIKGLFMEVLEHFESLHKFEVSLDRKNLTSSTMQAQPHVSLFKIFTRTNKYKVHLGYHIRDKEELIIAKVPDDVLRGWFAHELAHCVDYTQYNNLQMIWFGIRYLTSRKFRKKVEHDADYIAIKYGFYEEILATKDYILDHELIEDEYKEKIKKYYLPRETVMMCSKDKSLLEPYLHL